MTPEQRQIADISIIHKTYNFYLKLNSTVSSIPKKDRYTIGIKTENLTIKIIEKEFEANSTSLDKRLKKLRLIDEKLKVLQLFVRALFDTQAIGFKKYLMLSELLFEIGRMLGGWINDTQNKINKIDRG